MANKTFISNWQAILLVLFSSISTSVFFIPGKPVVVVQQDAWITVILATFLVAVLVIYPLADLGMRYPRKTIIQYSENVMGRFLGKIFGALLIYWFFQFHCWSLRVFAELIIVFLPETPILAIMIILALLVAFAAYNGLEVIGRCAEFVFPLGFISLVFIGLVSMQNIDLSHLLPVKESKILPLFRATIFPLDWLSINFFFCMITSFVANQNDLKKIGLIATMLSGAILTCFSIIVISVFGPDLTTNINFPLLALSKYVKIPVIERVETFIIIIWVSWLFIRGALSCYSTVLGLSQLLNLRDYRFLIAAESVLAIAYSNYQYDSFVEISYIFSIANLYYLFFQAGIPFTIWLISLTRTRLGQ